MTIIAYRNGIMAADTGCWGAQSLVVVGHVQKIKRLHTGALVAATGDIGDLKAFHWWVEREMPRGGWRNLCADSQSSFQGIVVRPGGRVLRFDSDLHPYEMEAEYHALGRASAFLLGALAAGSSAVKAAKLALKHTDAGAGTIQVESTNPTSKDQPC